VCHVFERDVAENHGGVDAAADRGQWLTAVGYQGFDGARVGDVACLDRDGYFDVDLLELVDHISDSAVDPFAARGEDEISGAASQHLPGDGAAEAGNAADDNVRAVLAEQRSLLFRRRSSDLLARLRDHNQFPRWLAALQQSECLLCLAQPKYGYG
jgi:hypothetical protein